MPMWPATILTGSRLPPSSSSLDRFIAFMIRRRMRRESSASRMSKLSRKRCDFRTGAQLTGRQAMKRADPVRRGVGTESSVDAARHLAGGFVREGDGKNAMGRNAVDRDPVGDGGG